jgi:spore coat protein U-like protein
MRYRLMILVPIVLCPALAHAGMRSATMRVSAYIVNNCVADVPSSMSIPAYTGTQVQSSAVLQLKCTKAASPVVTLGNGGTRAMSDGAGHQLAYQVYSDAGYNLVWNSVTEPPADGLTFASYTLYLAIPSGQSVAPGTYVDNLDVAVDPGTSVAKHYTISLSSEVQ